MSFATDLRTAFLCWLYDNEHAPIASFAEQEEEALQALVEQARAVERSDELASLHDLFRSIASTAERPRDPWAIGWQGSVDVWAVRLDLLRREGLIEVFPW